MSRFVFLGDFSGLSLFLSRGLERLGHEVALISNGDHWKNIPRQTNIWRPAQSRLGSAVNQLRDFPALLSQICSTDVLLLATEHLYMQPLNGLLLAQCLKRAGKVVLLHAGCSHNFNAMFDNSPLCQECKLHDLQAADCKFLDDRWPWMQKALEHVDIVQPFTSVYAKSAQGYLRYGAAVTPALHFPIDIGYLQSVATPRSAPRVIHGTNRPGFKGTVYLQRLMRARPSLAAQVTITARMGFTEFLGTVASTELVLDQLLANGYGMTGAIALALGTSVAYGHTEAKPANEFCGTGCLPFPISMMVEEDASCIEEHVERHLEAAPHPDDLRALCHARHSHEMIAKQFLNNLAHDVLR